MHLYIRLWGPNFYVSHCGLSEKLGSSSWIEPHKAFRNPHCNSQHIAENCLTYKELSSIYNRIICPLRQSTQANSEKRKKKKKINKKVFFIFIASYFALDTFIIMAFHKLHVFLILCNLTSWTFSSDCVAPSLAGMGVITLHSRLHQFILLVRRKTLKPSLSSLLLLSSTYIFKKAQWNTYFYVKM